MDFDEYQKSAMRTKGWFPQEVEQMLAAGLGIAGEAGEIVDELKKIFFHGRVLDKSKLIEEMGDELWYLALLCDALSISMDELATYNIAKLEKRYPDGFCPERRKDDGRVEGITHWMLDVPPKPPGNECDEVR